MTGTSAYATARLKSCGRCRPAAKDIEPDIEPTLRAAVRLAGAPRALTRKRFPHLPREFVQPEGLGNEVRIRVDRSVVNDRVARKAGREQHLELRAQPESLVRQPAP